MDHHLLTMIVLVAATGVAAQWAAWRLGVPAVVMLLAVGFLLGPAFGVLEPEAQFGAVLRPAIGAAVAVVVFEEGLNLDFAQMRAAAQGIWRMAAIGVPLSWALGAAAAHFLAGLSWPVAILLGAMLVITGPTVIEPLLREAKLARRPAAFLRWEGMLNDAVGAVLTVLTLEFLVAVQDEAVEATVLDTTVDLALGLVLGIALGAAAAFLVRFLFVRGYAPAFLKAPIVLAMALLIYGLTDAVQREAGLIAVSAFGIGLANMRLPEIEELKRFKEGLSVFLVSGLFIIIAATLPAERLAGFGLPEIAFVAAILFLVRPTAMLIATAGTDMSWRERLFVALIAPRGIVAAALAGLAGAHLAGGAYPDSGMILPLAFTIIAATVGLHGFLMAPFARALGLAAPWRPGLLLVGCNAWTVALARTLQALGTPVLVSDCSAEALRAARAADLTVHDGHILASDEEDRERFDDYEALLAATRDDAFNALVCQRFAPDFGAEHVYQTALGGGEADQRIDRRWRGKILIAEDATIDRLVARLDAGWVFAAEALKAADDLGHAFRIEPDRRLAVALIKPNGELALASPETKLAAAAHGTLIVFAAPPERRAGPAAGD